MDTAVEQVSLHEATDDQLIGSLWTAEDRLSRSLVDECQSRGERMLWRLTEICRNEQSWSRAGSEFWAPVHATFILGAFEDSRALMGLLASLRWSAKYDVDWVHEKLPSILGRIGRPAILPLKARVSDRQTPELDRVTELHALAGVSARHPIHQGEVLDFIRSIADDAEEDDWIRSVAASVLLKFVRPGDLKSIVAAAIRQEWSDRPPLFELQDIEPAYAGGRQHLESYFQDPLDFYSLEAIEARQRRWDDEAEDARWASGAEQGAPWIEEQRHRLLTKYEFTLVDEDDEARGDALWVAESMTEYLVWYEGTTPWRWNGSTSFSYLMDFFSRRVALDDPGRIEVVPENLLKFSRFCADRNYISAADLQEIEACVAAEREEFLAAALDADRRRLARAILEHLLAAGIDPRDPQAGPVRQGSAPVKERKTSRRTRRK